MKTPLDNFIESILTMYPDSPQDNLTRNQVNSVFNSHPDNRKGFIQFVNTPAFKLARGIYSVTPMQTNTDISPVYAKKTQSAAVTIPEQQTSLVPQEDPDFVPFGDFTLIYNLTKSKTFFPIYITGESGNGKTKMVYAACAKAKRELIRANITEVTDEDDLIGGFRLIDGNTVWQDGPAIEAMKRGAVLLLDEINLGSPKIMCLQPILEGMPI